MSERSQKKKFPVAFHSKKLSRSERKNFSSSAKRISPRIKASLNNNAEETTYDRLQQAFSILSEVGLTPEEAGSVVLELLKMAFLSTFPLLINDYIYQNGIKIRQTQKIFEVNSFNFVETNKALQAKSKYFQPFPNTSGIFFEEKNGLSKIQAETLKIAYDKLFNIPYYLQKDQLLFSRKQSEALRDLLNFVFKNGLGYQKFLILEPWFAYKMFHDSGLYHCYLNSEPIFFPLAGQSNAALLALTYIQQEAKKEAETSFLDRLNYIKSTLEGDEMFVIREPNLVALQLPFFSSKKMPEVLTQISIQNDLNLTGIEAGGLTPNSEFEKEGEGLYGNVFYISPLGTQEKLSATLSTLVSHLKNNGHLIWLIPEEVHHFKTINTESLKEFDTKNFFDECQLYVSKAESLQNSELQLYDPFIDTWATPPSGHCVSGAMFILYYTNN